MDFRAHTLSQIWAGRRGRNESACHHNSASSRRNHLHLSVCLTDKQTNPYHGRDRERESHRENGSPRATRPTSTENTARLSRLGAAAAAPLSVFSSPASHHNFAGGAYVNILPSSESATLSVRYIWAVLFRNLRHHEKAPIRPTPSSSPSSSPSSLSSSGLPPRTKNATPTAEGDDHLRRVEALVAHLQG